MMTEKYPIHEVAKDLEVIAGIGIEIEEEIAKGIAIDHAIEKERGRGQEIEGLQDGMFLTDAMILIRIIGLFRHYFYYLPS